MVAVIGMVTVRSGSALSVTLTTTPAASATEYAAWSKLAVTEGTSSLFVMLTVLVAVPPSVTSVGSVPKPRQHALTVVVLRVLDG